MNRTAIIVAAVAVLATSGVCFVALKPGALGTPTVDGSSGAAFKNSIDAVKQSLPKEKHEEFENAMSMLARAATFPPKAQKNPFAALAAMSADPGASARRLRGRLDGMSAAEVLAASEGLSERFPGIARNANESVAIAVMQIIASAQHQVQTSGAIDDNGNGVGEFGYFGELASGTPIRSKPKELLSPPVLSGRFAHVQNGRVQRSGYYFQMYLPGKDEGFQAEVDTGGATPNTVSAEHAEELWCCYAWPVSHGSSGERAFFVNQEGKWRSCRNLNAKYSGTENPPAPFAAFLKSDANMRGQTAVNATGSDGETWIEVK